MSIDLGELDPGEQILWSGSPARFLMWQRTDAFLVPFSILWCAFAIFWEASLAMSSVEPGLPLLLGAPAVLLGLYCAFGRLIVRHAALRRIRYVVTDRRVIMSSTMLGRHHQRSVYLRDLPPPTVSRRKGSIGTITFGGSTFLETATTAKAQTSWGNPVTSGPPMLIAVDGAREVRDLIATAQAGAPA